MTAPAITAAPEPLPPAVADLLPAAVDLAIETGELPARNRLMTHLKVGAPKAGAVRDALARVDWRTVRQIATHGFVTDDHARRIALQVITGEPEPAPVPAAHLHAVPDPDPDPAELIAEPAAPAEVEASDPPVVDLEPAALAVPDEQTPEPVAVAEVTTAPAQARTTATAEPAAAPRRPVTWPVLILCLPAFVAIWAGWVEMGRLTGFGKVVLLPGIADWLVLDTAITLPIGVETYAAYALWVWLSGRVSGKARRFAKRSATTALGLGALGQITYHLMNAWHWTAAPWPITALVACIPVAVLGMGAALAHLMHADQH